MNLLIVYSVFLYIISFENVLTGGNDQSEKNSPLHEAVLDDNFVNVKKLINKGADKNGKNYFGRTPLHLAAKSGFENITKYLIENNADIDVKDNYGKTPIFFAAVNGHFEIFKLLVQESEKRNISFVNATDILGMSLLHHTAMNRKPHNTEMLKMLLQRNASVNAIANDNTTALHWACRFSGNPDMIGMLLSFGADVNINFKDSAGNTPIIYAAYGAGAVTDRLKIFQLLEKNNADVNVVNNAGENILFFVTRYGGDDEQLAEFLIKRGARVNNSNMKGETPLHIAAKSGYKKIGECLIRNMANKDATNIEGQTPLHYAVKYGQIEFVELLIGHGANINMIDENGNKAIHLAAENSIGRVKILELLSKGDDIKNFHKDGKSLLHLSIENGGDMNTFKWLVEKGIHINVTDRDGCTLLHSAARNGRIDVVDWLIKHYPIEKIINKQDNYGNIALHYAVSGGYYDLAKILLSNGSDVNAMNYDFEYPIHLASGNEDIIKILIDHDASVNVKNQIDWTPLFYSVLNGNERVVKVLVNHEDEDFNINDVDVFGKTVFHICAEKGSVNIGKILYSLGANVSAIDKLGQTPLYSAVKNGNSEFVEWLIYLQSNADQEKANDGVNVVDKDGKSPLHFAAAEGHINIVKTLLHHGAQIDAKTKNNETAIMMAVQNGHNLVVDELLRKGADTSIPDEEKTLQDLASQKTKHAAVELLNKYDRQKKEEAQIFHIFILVIFILLIPLMCFIALFFHKLIVKEKNDGEGGLKLTDLLEKYMFPQNQVMLCTKIGKSVFGTVYKGYAHKILPHETETLVAIKVVNGPSDAGNLFDSQKMLLSLGCELKVMIQCRGHLNLVNLLGLVTENIAKHELMVIVEYCRFGNLKDVLEKHHKNVKNQIIDSSTMQITKSRVTGFGTARAVSRNDLASWSYQIAQGMQYIASHNIVHGNLAARSILLADGNIVKISDFGLARSMHKVDAYISEKEGKLEYKWLSIESMQHRILNTKSDVWSFGILLWELYSFGETPYRDIDIFQLKRHILSGRTMEKPSYANDNVYEVMQHCWRLNPESRPTFDSLEKWLYQLL